MFEKPAKRSYPGLSFGARYAISSHSSSKGLRMEVVEYEPDDSYEIRRTHCGCCRLGKISPEIILITKRAIDSPR